MGYVETAPGRLPAAQLPSLTVCSVWRPVLRVICVTLYKPLSALMVWRLSHYQVFPQSELYIWRTSVALSACMSVLLWVGAAVRGRDSNRGPTDEAPDLLSLT